MGTLVEGDDGLPVEVVGLWAEQKHEYLRRYVDITHAVRAKWIGHGKAGATYIDLYCGPGRSVVKDTRRYIDGGCVAAWKTSLETGVPFSKVVIADLDPIRRSAAVSRLRALDAPVVELEGPALAVALELPAKLNANALHFAFLDPFNLQALDFGVIQALSTFRYIDMLIHVSQMDHQRNWAHNVTAQKSAYDSFAPGWMNVVDVDAGPEDVRNQVMQYWRLLVETTGAWPSPDMRLIRGLRKQPLYWLLLAAKHPLAHRFWSIASNAEGQGSLF